MAVTYSQLATFIHDIVADTTGIGKIYTTPQDFRTTQEIEDNCYFGTPARLNVWFISRVSSRNSLIRSDGRPVPIGGVGARIHVMKLEGWYGYIEGEDTYTTFQDIITSLLNTVQGKRTKAASSDPALVLDTQDVEVEPRITHFAEGYIAHHCSLNFIIDEMYSVDFI